MQSLTEHEASVLARAITRQIEERHLAMKLEALWAFGFPTPENFSAPPTWVGAAIRVVHTGKAYLPNIQSDPASFIKAFGAIGGMAKMWETVLTIPPEQEADLEKRFPQLVDIRRRLKETSAPSLEVIKQNRELVENAMLKPELQLAYIQGEKLGASVILNDDGTLNEHSDIRSDVCYFLSLYWSQIQLLGSVRELEDFFRQMRQDAITRKNLEKICRDIGLKFKKPGRPKNLLSKKLK